MLRKTEIRKKKGGKEISVRGMTDEVAGWRLGGLQGFSGEEFQREKNRKEAAGGWVVFQRYFGRAEG